jgi:hypothetical protein
MERVDPDVLKEHNGHHAELKATLGTANKTVSVDDVKCCARVSSRRKCRKSGT